MYKCYRQRALGGAPAMILAAVLSGPVGAMFVGAFALSCDRAGSDSGEGGALDGGTDAGEAFDLCDAFTTVGSACPTASPTRCFPMCDAGGCFCRATAGGPQWACTTDLSCLPPCAPIDDACAATSD